MSRAFVDESSSDFRDEDAPEFKIPIPPGARNYITPKGAEQLSGELRSLETERPSLAGDILRLGSEPSNADALATARRRLGRLDRRIQYLSRMASLAEVVHTPADGYDRVRFGARVTVQDVKGMLSTFCIVGVDEADPEKSCIGWTSPLARALMGKLPGNTVTVPLPEGKTILSIVTIA